MTADSLTKVMQCPNMMELLTTGRVKFFNTGHSIEMKRLPQQTSVSEEDLLEGDNAITRNTEKAIKELYAHFGWVCAATAFGFSNKKPLARAVFFASMLTQTAAHKTEEAEDWIMGYFMILATMGVIAITLMLEWSRQSFWTWTHGSSTSRTTASTQTDNHKTLFSERETANARQGPNGAAVFYH